MTEPHYHKDDEGFLVKCYHGTKNLLTDWKFWLGTTIAFPIEHAIWTMTPLVHIAEFFGLFGPHIH